MDDEFNNEEQMLIKALRHEVQHLTMQVKMLQQSIDSLKNRNAADMENARNYLGALSIGKLKGQN